MRMPGCQPPERRGYPEVLVVDGAMVDEVVAVVTFVGELVPLVEPVVGGVVDVDVAPVVPGDTELLDVVGGTELVVASIEVVVEEVEVVGLGSGTSAGIGGW